MWTLSFVFFLPDRFAWKSTQRTYEYYISNCPPQLISDGFCGDLLISVGSERVWSCFGHVLVLPFNDCTTQDIDAGRMCCHAWAPESSATSLDTRAPGTDKIWQMAPYGSPQTELWFNSLTCFNVLVLLVLFSWKIGEEPLQSHGHSHKAGLNCLHSCMHVSATFFIHLEGTGKINHYSTASKNKQKKVTKFRALIKPVWNHLDQFLSNSYQHLSAKIILSIPVMFWRDSQVTGAKAESKSRHAAQALANPPSSGHLGAMSSAESGRATLQWSSMVCNYLKIDG